LAAQAVAAVHGLGGLRASPIQGQLGVGPHELAIDPLNDIWAGTPDTNWSSFVNSVGLDGPHDATAMVTLYSAGTSRLKIGDAPT